MIIVKLENPPTARDKEILCEITGNKEVEICFIQGFYHKEFYFLFFLNLKIIKIILSIF